MLDNMLKDEEATSYNRNVVRQKNKKKYKASIKYVSNDEIMETLLAKKTND